MARDKAWLQAQLQRHQLVEPQVAQARQPGCSVLGTATSSHRILGHKELRPSGPGCMLQGMEGGRGTRHSEQPQSGRSPLRRQSVCCSHRMKKRWKKQPTRSSLSRRPKKWPKSAPCLLPTSPLLRKAPGNGVGVALGSSSANVFLRTPLSRAGEDTATPLERNLSRGLT